MCMIKLSLNFKGIESQQDPPSVFASHPSLDYKCSNSVRECACINM